MEEKQETLCVTTNINNNNSPKCHNQDGLPKKKKRDGPFEFVKVAMYKLRSKNEQSPKPNQLQSASTTLKNVVGSMRPLHLQGDQSHPVEGGSLDPEPKLIIEPKKPMNNNRLVEELEVHSTPPMSPAQQSSASSSSCLASGYASSNDFQEFGHMSRYASTNALEDLGRLQGLGRRRYASTNDLQVLLQSDLKDNDNDEYDEDEEEDKYYDDKRGDEMIDFKAEEFIAKFYEQMRVQRGAYATKRW